MEPGIVRAIEAARGPTRLARAIGVTPAAVTNWRARGYVPAKMAPAVEAETGVPRGELCPDFPWGDNQQAAA